MTFRLVQGSTTSSICSKDGLEGADVVDQDVRLGQAGGDRVAPLPSSVGDDCRRRARRGFGRTRSWGVHALSACPLRNTDSSAPDRRRWRARYRVERSRALSFLGVQSMAEMQAPVGCKVRFGRPASPKCDATRLDRRRADCVPTLFSPGASLTDSSLGTAPGGSASSSTTPQAVDLTTRTRRHHHRQRQLRRAARNLQKAMQRAPGQRGLWDPDRRHRGGAVVVPF